MRKVDDSFITIFKRRYNLERKFIILYAGVLGYSQDLLPIILAISTIREKYPDIVFLVVGDGPLKQYYVKMASKLKVLGNNVVFAPYQPLDKYPSVIALADICLVPLRKGVSTPVVPKKLIDFMSAKKPVIAIVPKVSDVHYIVNKSRCGYVIELNNISKLVRILELLYTNEELREQLMSNAYSFAIKYFDIRQCISAYNRLIQSMLCNAKH